MDDFIELIGFLAEAADSIDIDLTDVGTFIENCDFLSISAEELEVLHELALSEETMGLFSGGMVLQNVNHHSGAGVELMENGITVDDGHLGEGQGSATNDNSDAEKETIGQRAMKEVRNEAILLAGKKLLETQQNDPQNRRAEIPETVTAPTGQSDLPNVAVNLFTTSNEKAVSMTRCACGANYSFLSVDCSSCNGNDPIGFLWTNNDTQILEHLEEQIVQGCCSTPMGLYSVLDQIQKGLSETVKNANDSGRLGNLEGLQEHEVARKMLDFFDPVFKVPYLKAQQIEAVKQAARREGMLVSETLGTEAKRFCSELGVELAGEAWVPTPGFNEHLAQRLTSIWSEPLTELGQDASACFLKAAAAYYPVRLNWEKQSMPEHEGVKVARWAWRGFKAFKTMGVSLAFEIGKSLMKSNKQQEQFDRFKSSLNDLLSQCDRLQQRIERAKDYHQKLLSKLGNKLTYHTVFSVADYYGPLEPSNQDRLANRVATFTGVADWKTAKFKERGIKAARKRKTAKILLWLIPAIFVLLLAGGGAAYYFGILDG